MRKLRFSEAQDQKGCMYIRRMSIWCHHVITLPFKIFLWLSQDAPGFRSLSLSFFFIGVELIYNVMLVSGVQQSDSVIHTYILFQILFPYRLLWVIEYSSLCYVVGPCWLSILYVVMCICSLQTPNWSLPQPHSLLITKTLLSMSVCQFLLCK